MCVCVCVCVCVCACVFNQHPFESLYIYIYIYIRVCGGVGVLIKTFNQQPNLLKVRFANQLSFSVHK